MMTIGCAACVEMMTMTSKQTGKSCSGVHLLPLTSTMISSLLVMLLLVLAMLRLAMLLVAMLLVVMLLVMVVQIHVKLVTPQVFIRSI
jgi:hypothetical protein